MNGVVTTPHNGSDACARHRSHTRRFVLFAAAVVAVVVATVWLVFQVVSGTDTDAAPASTSTVSLTDANGAYWASGLPAIWGPDLAELNAAFWAPPPVALSTIDVTEMYGAFWAASVS